MPRPWITCIKTPESPNKIGAATATGDFSFGVDDGSGAGANNFIIYDRINGAYRFVLTNAGNVGIGTTNPGATLEVNGHSKSKATIVGVYNAATGEDFRFFDVSNYGAIQINSGHSDIYSFRNGKRGQILYIYGAVGSGSFTIYHGVDIPYHCHTSAGAPKTISGHGGAIIIFAADDGHSFVMATYP